MGLFKSRPRLVRTSYEYDPPAAAVAWGWTCTSRENCAVTEAGVPRGGWPFACPRCGAPTDPAFEEPWKHEARGVELRYLLAAGGEDKNFIANELLIWRHADALRRGDQQEAREAREEFRAARASDREGSTLLGSGSFKLVAASLAAGDLDAAADDLVFWLDAVDGTGLEDDGGKRGECRQAMSAAFDFLDAPGGAQHPQAAAIRGCCLGLARDAFPQLLPRHQERIARLEAEG